MGAGQGLVPITGFERHIGPSLKMDDNSLEQKTRVVEFVQDVLRILSLFYVLYRYPDYITAIDRRLNPPEMVLHGDPFANLLEFMKQVTDRT